MTVHFVVVPQWQGSGSSRAMQLVTGAETIRGDLPAAATTVVEVPLEAGDEEGSGVHRLSALRLTRQRFAAAVDGVDDPIITIGGDCSVDYPAVAHAAARSRPVLVWFDAHADANDAESSPSHAFHGMVLRSLVDDGVINADRVIVAGARNLDDAEDAWLTSTGITRLTSDELGDPATLVAALRATDADSVYLHIDLDVLDPSEIAGIAFPEPFGLTTSALTAALRAARDELPFAGAGIAEFSPVTPAAAADDMGTILRVVGALTASTR